MGVRALVMPRQLSELLREFVRKSDPAHLLSPSVAPCTDVTKESLGLALGFLLLEPFTMSR